MPSNYTKKCLRFFAVKDSTGFPVVGTVQGYNAYEQLPCDNQCDLVELLPGGNPQPAGAARCFHPDGLRFFYQVTKSDKNPQVKSGTLMAAYQFPKSPNNCQWVEFYRWC